VSRRSDRFRSVIEERAADAVMDKATEALQRKEPRPKGPAGGLRERRIEWVTWGISIIILGVCFVIGGDALTLIFPLLAGGLMLFSATLQKILKNWNVSFITWGLGVILAAVGIERFIALFVTLDRTFNPIFLVGGLIIITGFVVLLQIFRRA